MPSDQASRVVVFDVGETLVDETRAWSQQADAAGVTRLTLFGALGALIERGEDHRGVWSLLGVDRPARSTDLEPRDFYPDAIPCLHELSRAGIRLGLAANQPAAAETALAQMGLPVSFVAASERWGVEKPAPEFFDRLIAEADVPAQQITYVGDRLDNDVLPVLSAGMSAILVRRGPWGHLHARRPEAALAGAVIDSLERLPMTLASLHRP